MLISAICSSRCSFSRTTGVGVCCVELNVRAKTLNMIQLMSERLVLMKMKLISTVNLELILQ